MPIHAISGFSNSVELEKIMSAPWPTVLAIKTFLESPMINLWIPL